jgi:prophage regulatory protein
MLPFRSGKEQAMSEKTPSLKRLPEVLNRVGYSRSTIYQLMAEGKFPKPISLGARAVGWLESDIDEWITQRIDQSRERASA